MKKMQSMNTQRYALLNGWASKDLFIFPPCFQDMEFGAGGLVIAAKLKNLSRQGAQQGLVLRWVFKKKQCLAKWFGSLV